MKWILQVKVGKEFETLKVFDDGRITCTCINNLYYKGREINSVCKHSKELRKNIIKGDLTKYYDIS